MARKMGFHDRDKSIEALVRPNLGPADVTNTFGKVGDYRIRVFLSRRTTTHQTQHPLEITYEAFVLLNNLPLLLI